MKRWREKEFSLQTTLIFFLIRWGLDGTGKGDATSAKPES